MCSDNSNCHIVALSSISTRSSQEMVLITEPEVVRCSRIFALLVQ
jgi:hypothetical protein